VTIQIGPGLRRLVHSSLLVCGLLLLFPACRSTRSPVADNSASLDLPPLATPPFKTKEPERYQAVRTITSSRKGDGPKVVTRTVIARDGRMRREEYETTAGQKIVYLEIPAGRFVLLPSAKLVASVEATGPVVAGQQSSAGEISVDLLLNETPAETRYERLGPEGVGGRSATKYRVLTRSTATNVAPDIQTLVWIDDELSMPLRWETTANSGNTETTTTMELSDITLDVDLRKFQLPPEYRKVDISAIQGPIGNKALAATAKPVRK
jgi:outer membrane lipoprotein-sorting protein